MFSCMWWGGGREEVGRGPCELRGAKVPKPFTALKQILQFVHHHSDPISIRSAELNSFLDAILERRCALWNKNMHWFYYCFNKLSHTVV